MTNGNYLMRVRVFVAYVGLLFLFAGMAFAVKLEVEVSAECVQQYGFSFTSQSDNDGLVTYTITRDLSVPPALEMDFLMVENV